MDIIRKAIEKKWHITSNENLNKYTWSVFCKQIEGKKLFLYGAGDGFYCFRERFSEGIILEGVIDKNLYGFRLDDIYFGDMSSEWKNLVISDKTKLKEYEPEEVVVLILSLKQYESIECELRADGYKHIFALLPMEAKERNRSAKSIAEYRKTYIETCLEEPVDRRKLVFYSMSGFSGHGKQIVLRLLKIRTDLDIVWIYNGREHLPVDGIRFVSSYHSKAVLYEMETAGFWIYDDMISPNYVKRPEQIYIQLKHWASVTLKTFGFDLTEFREEAGEIEVCRYNSQLMDYMITGSKFDTETCKRGFQFDGPFCEAGSARSDILFSSETYYAKVCEKYHIEKGKKLLLYAPTFRAAKGVYYRPEQGEIDLDFRLVKEAFERKFGGEWLILLRLHPVVAHRAKDIMLPHFVIDAGEYPDGEELVAASEVLITDYSSIMFEPAFVKKPVFLFATDRKEYIDKERKLLIPYDKLPFPLGESNEELVSVIDSFEEEKYRKIVEKFLSYYGVHEDGHAGERAARFVSDLVDGKEICIKN